MIEYNTIKIFKFPIFRYIRLLYSIPLTIIIILLTVWVMKFLSSFEPIFLQWIPGWAAIILPTAALIAWGYLVMKIFLRINSRVVSVRVDANGFQLDLPGSRKTYWSKIKTCMFPTTRYRNGAIEYLTIILGFGFMKKIIVIKYSRWWILNRNNKRKFYEKQFQEFSEIVRHYCQSKLE